MCDKKTESPTGFVAGALVGAVVGAVAAMLFSPTTPDDNRRKVCDAAKKYKEKGDKAFDDLKVAVEEKVEPVMTQVEQKLKPFIDQATRVEHVVEDMSEKVQQLIVPDSNEPHEDDPQVSGSKKRFFKGTRK
jgi:gas vesicle protein